MIFKETKLKGAYVIELEPIEDERGFFARTFCCEEFKKHGLNPRLAQCNISYNTYKGTLRGMHYQLAPFSEAKLVTCLAGSIYNVIVDLREESPTYGKWLGLELSARRPRPMLYVPERFANGFQTLADDTEVFYQMSRPYHPESARGLRWDDPFFDMVWPAGNRIVSQRDQSFPDFGR
jgi:dTDP-4-dehydrorhamnose 3,5-epimerase